MHTNTQNEGMDSRSYFTLKSQFTFFKRLSICLVISSILLIACSKDDDSTTIENCPEISLVVKKDANDKTKVSMQATSSITDGITYTWKVIDQKGSQEVKGNTDGSLSWKVKEDVTKFCVTVKTSDCAEGVEKCITYTSSCENKEEIIDSKPKAVFSKPIFKDGYMYYAKQQLNFLNISKLAIYKLNLADKSANPIQILNVEENIFGEVKDLVFKDDILYISLAHVVLHSKVFKVDTSVANPVLVEVLDLKFKDQILGMIVKSSDMYSVSLLKAKLYKFDLTKPTIELNGLTTFGKRSPHEEKTWTMDMVSKGDELYILARSKADGYHIIKVDLNDASLTPTIIVSNMKESNRLELYGDDLYLLFRNRDAADGWVGNWIGKINTLDSSPSLDKVGEDYNFQLHDFSFYKEFMYMSILDAGKEKFELVKIPICSL